MKEARHKGPHALLRFHLYEMSRIGKSIETKWICGCLGLAGLRGLGTGADGVSFVLARAKIF